MCIPHLARLPSRIGNAHRPDPTRSPSCVEIANVSVRARPHLIGLTALQLEDFRGTSGPVRSCFVGLSSWLSCMGITYLSLPCARAPNPINTTIAPRHAMPTRPMPAAMHAPRAPRQRSSRPTTGNALRPPCDPSHTTRSTVLNRQVEVHDTKPTHQQQGTDTDHCTFFCCASAAPRFWSCCSTGVVDDSAQKTAVDATQPPLMQYQTGSQLPARDTRAPTMNGAAMAATLERQLPTPLTSPTWVRVTSR